MSLSKKSAITFLTQSVIFILGIGTSIILARALGPTNKGIYTLIILIPTLMLKLGTLGIETASVYYTGSKKYTTEDMVSNALFSGSALGVILIILFFVLMNFAFFENFLYANQINHFYLWLAVLIIPLVMVSNFLKAVILGKEKIVIYNKIDIFQAIFQLMAVAVFILLLRQGVLGGTISYVLTMIGTAIFVFIKVRGITKLRFALRMDALTSSIAYGWKPYIGIAAQFLNYRLSMIILAFFLPPAAIGYYSISVLLAERLWMIPMSIGTVLFPRISSLKDAEANALTPRISRFTLFIVLILSVAMAFISRPLIHLFFGREFLPAVAPFLILLPGVIIIAAAKVLTSDLGGRGKPEIGMFSALVSLAINIPLNIFLIPKWGIAGAACATSLAYIIASLIVMICFKRISNTSWSELFLLKTQDFRDCLNLFNQKRFFNPD